MDRRTRVASLSQFMAVVKRAATGRLWRSRPGLAPVERRFPLPGSPALVGPTRRWVIAGGAGLLAISSLPPMPGDTKAAAASMPDDETASGDDTPRRRA